MFVLINHQMDGRIAGQCFCKMRGLSKMWNQLLDLFEKADRSIDIIEGNIPHGIDEIQEIGASPESVLGAVIVNACGIVFDKWVFVIGQSSDKYGILNFGEKMNYDSSGLLVVATDIVGGIFALNMGRFPEDQGLVWYFAPDTLEWESLEMKYSQFIAILFLHAMIRFSIPNVFYTFCRY